MMVFIGKNLVPVALPGSRDETVSLLSVPCWYCVANWYQLLVLWALAPVDPSYRNSVQGTDPFRGPIQRTGSRRGAKRYIRRTGTRTK